VEEGVEWAEAASADVIEEYAQQRRRQPNVADASGSRRCSLVERPAGRTPA
jgi:hypothetical protein